MTLPKNFFKLMDDLELLRVARETCGHCPTTISNSFPEKNLAPFEREKIIQCLEIKELIRNRNF